MERTLPISITATESYKTQELYSPDYLLLLPLRGTVTLKGLDTLQIQTGTMIFLAPFSGRKLYLDEGSSVLHATISANYLESMIGLPQNASLVVLKEYNHQLSERMVDYFDLCCNSEEATYLQKMGGSFDLLRALEPALINGSAEKDPSQGRSFQMASYLSAHFREPLQLSDLAEKFGVTRQHISTLFHKELGVPFSSYLLRLRLNEAQRLLLTTDKNITTISEESGFPNLRAFNVAFRNQQGCSPKEYRQKKQTALQDAVSSPEDAVLQSVNQLLQPYRMVYNRSKEAVTVSDEIKAGPGVPYTPVWQDTLNIDNSADLLQSMVQESLRDIQKNLSFRYIRLINLLCHELTPFLATTGQHRFTMFFRVIDFVKNIGLTPMVAFGDSYNVLFDSVMLNDGSYSVAEADWLRQLASVLDASISHWARAGYPPGGSSSICRNGSMEKSTTTDLWNFSRSLSG